MKLLKRLIGDMFASSIAARLDDFMYDFDPYEYNDNCESREEGFSKALEIIKEDSIDCFRVEEYLEDIIEEMSYDLDQSRIQKDLIKRARKVLKSIALYRKFRFKYHIAD